MNKTLVLLSLILLGGCASQAYYDHTHARTYVRTVQPVTSAGVYYYDDWLDQPFWTLDPWYYPASAYRNYSYGVTWVAGPHLYVDYYSYPVHYGDIHYSPIYVSGWWYWNDWHGHGYHGLSHALTDFWWHDHHTYSTRHGARREVRRLQRHHAMPRPAYRGHAGGERAYRDHARPRYRSVEHGRSVRAVRGAYGREDGHRGRSSVGSPHTGRRSMPFVGDTRRGHDTRGHGHVRANHRSAPVTHERSGRSINRAGRELHRIGYSRGLAYPDHAGSGRHRQQGSTTRRWVTEKPAYAPVRHETVLPQPANRQHTYERKGNHAVSGEGHGTEWRARLPQPASRGHSGSSQRRLPMMSVRER